ncbi:MAG: DUF362 domain-containing protein [Anaerolineae bacterium]|nr:DUF362 domain-containing protein [Anaerolineae bacterium]
MRSNSKRASPRKTLSRRRFLQRAGIAAAGLLAAGCCPRALIEAVESTAAADPTVAPTLIPTVIPTSTPTAVPSSTPVGAPTEVLASAPTVAPTSTEAPTAAPMPAPTATSTPVPRARVAIARADSYDRALVRGQIEALLDGIGGLGDVVRPGDRVAIKVNLTGGSLFGEPGGVPPIESYVTHPEIVRALGELLWDAGAGEIYIVEGLFEPESYVRWGYVDMAEALGATLIDLNKPAPYGDFALKSVGAGAFIYEAFDFHHILEEVDVFISATKMKCHWYAGVTLSIKNLVGLVPMSHYQLDAEDTFRSALHGPTDDVTRTRLPRVILDLFRARPIDLALIDGIKTVEGGEGPWIGCFNPVQPGVLVAGKEALAADAVAAAVMGFDPTADYPSAPFLRGDNHLNLACGLGLGTNRLGEIGGVGAAIDDVRQSFNPCWG